MIHTYAYVPYLALSPGPLSWLFNVAACNIEKLGIGLGTRLYITIVGVYGCLIITHCFAHVGGGGDSGIQEYIILDCPSPSH